MIAPDLRMIVLNRRPTNRVLIADDHPVFRESLRKVLDSNDEISIVGEASNGNDCITMLIKLPPDIPLLDLRMPYKDGLTVLEEVNFDEHTTCVVILTAVKDDRLIFRAFGLGARSVVLKQTATDLLIESIQKVHSGEIWLHPPHSWF
jgi:DNA-binding NarL/FixJ family response regulator